MQIKVGNPLPTHFEVSDSGLECTTSRDRGKFLKKKKKSKFFFVRVFCFVAHLSMSSVWGFHLLCLDLFLSFKGIDA